MLTTSLILPHPLLRDFVYNYAISQIPDVINLTYPCFANHETTLAFFLGDRPILMSKSNSKDERKIVDKIGLFGLLTDFGGSVQFKGVCNTFLIEFKPNGFNKLFRIAANNICNTCFPAHDVIGKEVEQLYEQLINSGSTKDKISLADTYLLRILNSQRAVYSNDGITKISDQLLDNTKIYSISEYAYKANMSVRNFERLFYEQVGTSPKLFCRLLRFNKAFKSKINSPKMSWSDIAFESGYYDSLHLIKDFKEFANASPAILFNENPGFQNVSFETLERESFSKTY